MKKQKTIIHFICYSPRIYSGFDRFNLLLASKIIKAGYLPVFVFEDTLKHTPEIRLDLESIGAKTELIPSKNKLSLIYAIWCLFYKYKPTIVHIHFVDLVKIIGAFCSLLFSSKFYVTFHSVISSLSSCEYQKQKGALKRYLLLIYYRFLIRSSRQIFTVSDAIKYQFLDFASSKSDRVNTVYLGVNLCKNEVSKKQLRSLLKLPQDNIILCNISAIEHIKGLDVIINAIWLLKNKFNLHNFLFCHIGGLRNNNEFFNTYRNSIFSLVTELGIEDKVIWLGKRNNVPEIISAFDIYVHPSRMEGLGVANMEAATHSLPIIGANVGGIPEIVKNGKNGFLFESENSKELAEHLFKLITDETLRVKMGSESLRIANTFFNIEKQTDALIQYYSEDFNRK